MSAELPKGPEMMPMYRVVGDESIETVAREDPHFGKFKENLPSEKEAVRYALKALEKYGGLPADAKLSAVRIAYGEKIEYSNGSARVVYKKPTFVSVSFKRYLNKYPVVGPEEQ